MQNCRMRYNLFIWPRSLRCCSYVVSENTCAYALHRLTAQSESFQSTMLWLCKGLVIDSLSNESLSEVRDYSKYLQQHSPTFVSLIYMEITLSVFFFFFLLPRYYLARTGECDCLCPVLCSTVVHGGCSTSSSQKSAWSNFQIFSQTQKCQPSLWRSARSMAKWWNILSWDWNGGDTWPP